ncbi:MAG: DUF4232 domain-containing protein [Mycobacterium kyogaense]|uniref:DUF4232 domain-containing protein n=1 Tax=Mycobacterium kyogaense TaxID=2212479 RepID=UPI002FFA4F9D
MRTTPLLISGTAAAVLLAGCGSDHPEAPSTTVTVTAAPSTTQAPPAATTSMTTTAAPTPSETTPSVPVACGNDDLTVAAGPVAEADTLRRVDVTFTNSSATVCVLVGYPGADLVTAAGGVLVHVARRPQNSAPHLELQPGEKATADVQSSAIDTSTGNGCGRTGTLVVTAPNTTASHLLEVNLPICDATISSVG